MLTDFRERERERERNIDCLPPAHTLTGDQTHSLGMCPDQELNQQPPGAWDEAQPADPPSQGCLGYF